jgi:hypothetical protein
MATPSVDSVLGAFDGAPVSIDDGTVTPRRDATGYLMEIGPRTADQQVAPVETARVDLVLGAGRQHQVYLTKGREGAFQMLPIIWLAVAKRWLPTSRYQRGAADPAAPDYWRGADLMGLECMSCHLSQVRYRVEDRRAEIRWGDLSVNCESCHGPGREHVRRRRAGESPDVYRDLHAIGKEQDVQLCGQCHGMKAWYHFGRDERSEPFSALGSLALPNLRPDGTQGKTAYQVPGHLLSRCFQEGSLACLSCHGPHDQRARDLTGASAEGKSSDGQCTVCHRNRIDVAAKACHHQHPPDRIRCVDCHMPYSWIGDTPVDGQRTSDHSVSVPRPMETVELGTPNACTTCHDDRSPQWAIKVLKDWGYTRAAETRPWVSAVALGKQQAFGATPKLLAVLEQEQGAAYLQTSVLELLALQAPYARVAAAALPFAEAEDPGTRLAAYRALWAHDRPRRNEHRRRASADRHPLVRMEAFLSEDDARTLDRPTIELMLRDVTQYASRPPVLPLLEVSRVLREQGDAEGARKVAEAARRISLASQDPAFTAGEGP